MAAFRKILVANRGEIALRVMRACRELEISPVAVYSDADHEAPHVRAADEAFRLGPAQAAQSYLKADKLLEVARRAGCDALHPGYGFLAENADFARRCGEAGVAFIGPSPNAIEAMGSKLAARAAAAAAGINLVPGTTQPVRSANDVRRLGKQFGYPIAIKASAGGGGKGLKVAQSDADVPKALDLAAMEAAAYFKDDTLYVEKYLTAPKHVEVQVLCDKHGNTIHVGERECSMQRRHQKLIEETPANINAKVRAALLDDALKLARSIRYDSAGTIECLVQGEKFYFLEMNTRIQVEHPVTEMVWGLDLVKAQIRIAAGEALWLRQNELVPRGHAIECRINAESPAEDFRPCAGRIERYVEPAGPGVRVDAAAYPGYVIPAEYDSLLGKVVVWGQDREEARLRMLRALSEYQIEGVSTTIPFLALLLRGEEFIRGTYVTQTVDRFRTDEYAAPELALRPERATLEGGPVEPATLTVEVNDKRFVVRVLGDAALGGQRSPGPRRAPRFKPAKRIDTGHTAVGAPMHGIVAEIRVKAGDPVEDGQVVAVIEAMKMMNEVVAHRAGTIARIDASVGQTVETGAPLVTFAT